MQRELIKKIMLASLVSIVGMVNAQQTKFGIKAGYALSNIESKEFDNTFEDFDSKGNSNAKSGFYAGAFIEHKLNEKFALQGEVQYADLGGKVETRFSEEGFQFTLQDKFHFNQILIPITARYFVNPQLAIYAGPSVAFTTGYKSDITIKDSNLPKELVDELDDDFRDLENQQNISLKENLKSTNFNIIFGAEYELYKGISIDARYTLGLTNYEKNTIDNSKTRMNYFQIGLAYKFK